MKLGAYSTTVNQCGMMATVTQSAHTYYYTVVQYWEKYRGGLIQTLKGLKEALIWCGDGRFDSVGHSAKYGAYTMYCSTISKIVHFEVLQVGVVFFSFILSILSQFNAYFVLCYIVLFHAVLCFVVLRCAGCVVTSSSCSVCNPVNK